MFSAVIRFVAKARARVINDAFDTAADNLDASFLLVVENVELSLLLSIVEGTNHHLRKYG